MSIQEANLQAIANAIRQKDGTTGVIKASNFAARILAIPTGGGSGSFAVPLTVTVEAGAQITATNGSATVTDTAGEDGTATLILPESGVWTVTASLDGKEKSTEVEIMGDYTAKISLSSRLPDGYTEVEYIQLDHDCGINTALSPIYNKTRVVLNISLLDDLSSRIGFIFNCTSASIGGQYRWFYNRIQNNDQITYSSYSSSSISQSISFGTEKFLIDYDAYRGLFLIKGNAFPLSTNSATNPNKLYLGRNSLSVQSAEYKLYSAQIYQGEDKVRDFVPCVNAAGATGLFDLVESEFYENAVSGTITLGPAV